MDSKDEAALLLGLLDAPTDKAPRDESAAWAVPEPTVQRAAPPSKMARVEQADAVPKPDGPLIGAAGEKYVRDMLVKHGPVVAIPEVQKHGLDSAYDT